MSTDTLSTTAKENEIVEQETLKLAILNAQLCQDKLAEDVFIMDLKNVESAPSDYFVVCSCGTEPQVQAIADLIYRTIREYGLQRPRIEGAEVGEWAVMDYFDLIVHLMLEETRNFYKLEKLWGDAIFYTVDNEANLHQIDYEEVLRIYN